ncbi:MAG: ferritin-like domain-containing protein [Chitinophagaceae bacterium]|nr:MAG: ferritin-like domain-containing protein [Chitinophagaceae bacterium]
MNVKNLLHEIEKVDPEVYEKLDSRRNVMQRFSFIGKTLALAAVPSALGAMFNKAYGQTNNDVIDVLRFAYLLENLEAEFYKRVVSGFTAIGVPAGPAQAALTTIRDHEIAHVNFLKTVLGQLNVTPPTYTAASFDFTGGNGSGTGPFAPAFTNYGVMLAVAQAFEDTGVRAYKGQAPRLINNNDVLQAALQIHSVEARHASHIRQMRRNLASGSLIPSGVTLQPWITGAQSGIDTGNAGANAAIQMIYAGEDAVTQAMVAITNIGGNTISANEASESFDEPLSKTQVEAIVDPFIV